MNRTRTALVGLALTATALWGAAPAQARAVDHWQWSQDRAFTVDTCGFPTDVTDHFEGNGIARTTGGSTDGIATSQYTTRYVAVTTNPANGKWFTLAQSSMFQERGLTDLGGGLWGYSVNQAGQPFVITDSTGRVVVRDRGLIQFDGVYDANTDQVTSFELSGMAGPHPGYSADLCEITRDLIG
jgi:uncharacterized protein RhaS with RHS repeats